MNKVDLIQALKDSNNLSKSEAEAVINRFFNKMAAALTQGERVEIRGLCSFYVKKYLISQLNFAGIKKFNDCVVKYS